MCRDFLGLFLVISAHFTFVMSAAAWNRKKNY